MEIMRIKPRASTVLRCAVCHGVLRPAVDGYCGSCGSRFHEECRTDLERCPTLGCRGSIPRTRRPLLERAVFLGLVALGPFVLATAVIFGAEEIWARHAPAFSGPEARRDAAWRTSFVPPSAEDLEREVEAYTKRLAINQLDTATLIARGKALCNQGNLEGARHDLTSALDIDANDYDALINRGLVLTRLGQSDKAILDLTRAIEFDGSSPRAWWPYVNRSSAYSRKGMGVEALADAERAIAVDPGMIDGWVFRGYAHQLLGHQKDAIADYQKALRHLDPRSGFAPYCTARLAELGAQVPPPEPAETDNLAHRLLRSPGSAVDTVR